MAPTAALLLAAVAAAADASGPGAARRSLRRANAAPSCAAFSAWPSVDNDVTCGACRALVLTSPYGGRCDTYCQSFGHVCTAAAEERSEGCEVLYSASCSAEIRGTSDMLCTCEAPPQAAGCDAQCALGSQSYSCRARVEWLGSQGQALPAALQQVNQECATQCACSTADFATPINSSTTTTTTTTVSTVSPGAALTVMSYNTQYSGYPGKVWSYGGKIRDVGAAVVGTQECQDKYALAQASGYQVVPGTDFQNPIFYDPEKVSLVPGSGGWMSIPRDNHATRTITWGRFTHGSADFWFFNTHLPHNHGAAWSRNTHARIAQMLLQRRAELGAADAPTVVVGDCNPFASNGASEGSFESNLAAAGLQKSYQARGNPGHSGLDKIFASPHWASSDGADRGTGGSDHPAITVDLVLGR